MSLDSNLKIISSDSVLAENFMEQIVTDFVNQLEILSFEDCEDFVSMILKLSETSEGLDFLTYMIGVEDIEIYIEEFMDFYIEQEDEEEF